MAADELQIKRSSCEMSAFAHWTGSDAYAVAFAYCVFILKTIWGLSATLAKHQDCAATWAAKISLASSLETV